MEVNFYATLRQIAGTKTVEFPFESEMTVKRLIDVILERYPEMKPELLDANDQLYGHVHVIINGRDYPFLDNAQHTVLSIEDKVDVFPAIGGGTA